MDIPTFAACVSRFAVERIVPSLPPGAPQGVAAMAAAVVRIRPSVVRRALEAAYPALAPFGVVRADGTVDAGVAGAAVEGWFKAVGKVSVRLDDARLRPFLARLGIRVPAGLKYEFDAEDAKAFCAILAEYEPPEVEDAGAFSVPVQKAEGVGE